jgi:hypothetical protein
MRASLAAVLVGTSVVGGAGLADDAQKQKTGDRERVAEATPGAATRTQTTADAALAAVTRFIWGERARPADADRSSWVIERLTDAQVGGEAPFVKPGDRVWRLTGRQQRLDIRHTDGSVESLDRTVEAYVHAASGLVLKVVVMDEARSPRAKDVLEPLEHFRRDQLERWYESWDAPPAPTKTSLIEALESVVEFDPRMGPIEQSRRIVAHALQISRGTMYTQDVWSVDVRGILLAGERIWLPRFTDASSGPMAAGPILLPPVTQRRFIVDLATGRMLTSSHGPSARGEWERSQELERRLMDRMKRRIAAGRAQDRGARGTVALDPNFFIDPFDRTEPPYLIYETLP